MSKSRVSLLALHGVLQIPPKAERQVSFLVMCGIDEKESNNFIENDCDKRREIKNMYNEKMNL